MDEDVQVEPGRLTPTDPGPVMISWAHRPNPSNPDQPITDEDWDAWRDAVLDFTTVLRSEGGVTAKLDLLYPGEDWTRWGPLQIQQCPWTLVVVNAAWKERFEGTNKPTEGAGAVAEANVLHRLFQLNQADFHRRMVLVVLPGASEDDIPLQLGGIQRFIITEFTVQGLEGVLRHLTGQPLYVPPPVGTVPVLPPAMLEAANATVQAAAETSATSSPGVSSSLKAELRDRDAVLRAGLRAIAHQSGLQEVASVAVQAAQMQSLTEAIGQMLASSPAFQEAQRRAAAAVQVAIASSQAASVASARAAFRLTDLLGQVGEAVEGENRCWLLLAGVLGDPDATAAERRDGRFTSRRRREQVSSWISRTHPPVPLGQDLAAERTTDRVILSAPSSDAAAPGAASSAWRLELGDHGEAVAAANIASDIITGTPFDPPLDGRRQYFDLHLPVRMDLLELWLLTQVQLLTDHLTAMAAGRGEATVFLRARLLLPDHLTHPDAYPRHGVRLVAVTREADGRRGADSAVPGATGLQLGQAPPEVGPLRTTVQALSDPAELVRTTQSMAVELLERFGVEETRVLLPDGALDELEAADQQAVWVHAGALGLDRDEVSPAQRRDRYEELLAQARAALRR